MSVLALTLVASAGLAAGTAVDATARAEARTSFLSEPVADGFSNNLTVVGLTPTLRASHQGEGVFLDANYAPNLSAIYPSSEVFLVMHRFGGQANMTLSPRLRLGFDVTGAIGDLDAGAAVRDLGNSRASAILGGGQLTQFPFASVITGGTLGYRLDPRFTLNVGVRNEFTGSPTRSPGEQALLPMQVRPQTDVGITWLLTPTDSITGDLSLRSAFLADKYGTIGNGGGFVSAQPSIAFNRTIANGVVSTSRVGWATAIVDEGTQRDLLLHGLPLVDTRLQASAQLGGEGAIEGTVLLGVSPFSDPLGGLLEERVSGGVQGAWRVDRNLSFTTSLTAFSTLYAVGGNAEIALESSTAVGGSVGVGYNITEWIAVTAETLGTSRVVVDKFGRLAELRPEVTFVVGFTGAINLFHQGERPAGTDPRPGRAVGTRPVSLPGSARAFKGTRDDDDAKKKKAKKSGFASDKKKLDALNDSQLQSLLQDDKLLGEADRKALKKELGERKKKAAEAQKKLDDEKHKKDQKAKATEDREAEAQKKKADEDARKKKKKKAAAAAADTTP
jgi:hypothetical protein